MSRFIVYHRTHAGDFDRAAEVEAKDLEAVFDLTNHGDRVWWSNDGVTMIGAGPRRSTSVGDQIEDTSAGERWAVAGMGFEKVSEGSAR